MLENPDFKQEYWSRTAGGVHKVGHDGIRLMKWLVYIDESFFANINYYDLLGSILKCLNETSQR